MTRIRLSAMFFCFCSGSICSALEPRIQTIAFELNLIDKYKIIHGTCFGGYPSRCAYNPYHYELQKTKTGHYFVGDIVDSGKDIRVNFQKEGKRASESLGSFLWGCDEFIYMGGGSDPGGKPIATITKHLISFETVADFFSGDFSVNVSLQRATSCSISNDIENMKWYLGTPVAENSSWEEEVRVQRNGNSWIRFKYRSTINRLNLVEDWYLSIGDGEYYYKLRFSCEKYVKAADPSIYERKYASFSDLIDSFHISRLTTSHLSSSPGQTDPDGQPIHGREPQGVLSPPLTPSAGTPPPAP